MKTPRDYLSQRKIFQRTLADAKGANIQKDWAFFMDGVKDVFDNRLKPREKKIETFTFVRPKNEDITVSARVEYLYEAMILNPAEMKVVMAETSRKISK